MVEKVKVGIFGGTFDPWHIGHQTIVDTVIKNNIVDIVQVVPTIVDYHRPGKEKWLSDIEKYNVMCEFISRSKFQDKIYLDFKETRMKNNGELTDKQLNEWRFINTLERIKQLYVSFGTNTLFEIYTIIGTDSLTNFKTWHRWNDILKHSRLIVINGRNGINESSLIEEFNAIEVKIPDEFLTISSSDIRNRFKNVNDYLKNCVGD